MIDMGRTGGRQRVARPPAWWRAKHADTQRKSDAVGGSRIMKLRYQAFRAKPRRRER